MCGKKKLKPAAMFEVKEVRPEVTAKNSEIKEDRISNKIGIIKGSITRVLEVLLTVDIIEEYKPELKMIREQLNKSTLL